MYVTLLGLGATPLRVQPSPDPSESGLEDSRVVPSRYNFTWPSGIAVAATWIHTPLLVGKNRRSPSPSPKVLLRGVTKSVDAPLLLMCNHARPVPSEEV